MAKTFNEIFNSIKNDRMALVKLKKRYEMKRAELTALFSNINCYDDLRIEIPYSEHVSPVTKSVVYGVISNDFNSKICSIIHNINRIDGALYELKRSS